MKPWHRLVIAVIVLAAIVGYLNWPRKAAAVAAAPALVKFSSNDVHSLGIQQPGQPEVLLSKAGSDWKLTQPYAYAADGPTVSSLLDALADITGAQDVGAVKDPAAFGLDHPSVVTLGMANGSALELDFGSDTPTGGNSYLRLGATGAVKIVSSDVKSSALKSAFLLQDKAIVHYPAGQLASLDVISGGKHAHFDRADNAWPKDQQANIQSLLDALQDGQMTAMPDAVGKDAAADGLAKPAIAVSLVWKGGAIQLDIGAKKGAGEYYARNSSSPAIFTLSDYLITDINALFTAPPAVTGVKK
ncbi:MAG: DUF4340 domain-containing protein [Terriglobales bacterium]